MLSKDRYLHFDNIDMREPNISSRCSVCGLTFKTVPQGTERMDEVLLRLRRDYDAHECNKIDKA
jgi:hypothetical protein